MRYDELEILNPYSTDPSKIYRGQDGRIFRIVNSELRSLLEKEKFIFLFDSVDQEKIYLRRAEFHIGVSCWCSAQVAEYLEWSERLQRQLSSQGAHLSDGHPWNFVYSHSDIKFVDFGSVKTGTESSDHFWTERAEYAPLKTFFFVSYCGRLRRRLAENVHEPAPIPHNVMLSLGFQGLADQDCHTTFEERLARIHGRDDGQRAGKWTNYRETAHHSDLVAQDPRCWTLTKVLTDDPSIRRVLDIGANDGLHSRFCSDLGLDVLALEIEDASACKLFAETKARKESITVACTTLADYVYHLKFINSVFHPSFDLCLLFAVFHHMVHNFGYDYKMLFEELRELNVRTVLLEFIDYEDIHLVRVENKKSWYSLAGLEAFIASAGATSTVYPQHEQGRQLVLIENLDRMYERLTRAATSTSVSVPAGPEVTDGNDAALLRLAELTQVMDKIKRYTLWRYVPVRFKLWLGRMLKF